MANAEVEAATRIAAQTSYVRATDLFEGPKRPYQAGVIPHKAIFCIPTNESRPQRRYLNGASSPVQYHNVQVYLRGDVDDWDTHRADVLSVRSAFVDWTPSGYVHARIASGPAFLGFDETEHPVATINVEFWLQ